MPDISSSVGRGGRNLKEDVKIVQRLLNQHLMSIPPTKRLVDDGEVGPLTLKAIELLQTMVLHISNPDCRVDPGGRTLRALNGQASGPAVPARTVRPRPNFLAMMNEYPTVASPCDQPYDNQCSIRMSIALNGVGLVKVNASTYSEPKCPHGHARGAESLAGWLRRQLGEPRKWNDGATAKRVLATSQGIMFFKDCFTRSGETTRRGDHIDLWYRGATRGYSDQANKSAQIWFRDLP